MSSSLFTFIAVTISILFFAGILLCMDLGWRMGRRHLKSHADDLEGTKAIEAALLGLLGLLFAFTFSGAASRFDSRRLLVVQETNIIGTAYLRLDLLPEPPRTEIKKLFRDYLDLRIDTYRKLGGSALRAEKMAATQALQGKIWDRVVAALRQDDYAPVRIMILPNLNEMFDITTTRLMWTRMHPPLIIFILLAGIGLACAGVAGYSMSKGESRRWFHSIGFAFVLAFTFYVILDLEFPRMGFIHIHAFDQAMIDLRESMK